MLFVAWLGVQPAKDVLHVCVVVRWKEAVVQELQGMSDRQNHARARRQAAFEPSTTPFDLTA